MRLPRVVLPISLIAVLHGAQAASPTDDELRQRFELMDSTQCTKVKAKEPAFDTNVYTFAERHYLNLDGSGTCQILDAWVGSVNPDDPNESRLEARSVVHRFANGKWIDEYGLDYAPKYQLRDKTNGRIYYLVDFSAKQGLYGAHGVRYLDKWLDEERRVGPAIQICIPGNLECPDEETLRRAFEILSKKK
jgi:hypothetical protein